MIAAHVVPRPGGLGAQELLVDGRPSILFALVAGVSLGLMTGQDAPPALGAPSRPGLPARAEARWRLLIRALALLALGLGLWLLPHGIAVILDYYGVMFLLMIPLLFARRVVLAVVATVVLVAAPLLRDEIVTRGAPETGPLATIVDYLLTGWYPALLWVPLLAVGLLAARAGLGSARVRAALLAGGATASVAGYGAAAVLPAAGFAEVDAAAHSGTIAELLGSGGLAAAVLGLCLVLLDPPTGRAPIGVRIALAPLSAMGRVALSVYVGQVLVIAALSPLGGAGRFDGALGWGILIVLLVASTAFALACRALGRRGPLEWLLTRLADLPFGPRRVRD